MPKLLCFTLALLLISPGTAVAECQVLVTDTDGSPLPATFLVISPKYPRIQVGIQPAQTVSTDRDGKFDCDSLPSGSFFISAMREGSRSVVGWVHIEELVDYRLTITLAPIEECKEEAGGFRLEYVKMPQSNMSLISQRLRDFDEPRLCSPVHESVEEAYRFLWSRSFHPAIVATVTFLKDGSAYSSVKELRQTETGTYRLIRYERREVQNDRSSLQWTHLSDKAFIALWKGELGRVVWNAPAEIVKPPDLDGATWTIEARKPEQCHAVSRSNPEEIDKMRYAGSWILRLANWKVFVDEIYYRPRLHLRLISPLPIVL